MIRVSYYYSGLLVSFTFLSKAIFTTEVEDIYLNQGGIVIRCHSVYRGIFGGCLGYFQYNMPQYICELLPTLSNYYRLLQELQSTIPISMLYHELSTIPLTKSQQTKPPCLQFYLDLITSIGCFPILLYSKSVIYTFLPSISSILLRTLYNTVLISHSMIAEGSVSAIDLLPYCWPAQGKSMKI